MPKIAILDDYQNKAQSSADWDSIDGADITVFTDYIEDEDDVAKALAGFEVIVAMRERTPFPASLLNRLDALKLLVTTGMRNNAIDTDAARAKGIDVCGTTMPPYPAFELAWALMLSLARKIPYENQVMHTGGWQQGVGIGLHGKTLGILGLGRLGKLVAATAQTFGMNVIAWSQNLTAEAAAEVGVARVEREDLFRQSDLLSIHLILSERTEGIVGADELALMKPTAYLINTARGPLVDEAALIKALTTNTIAGAGIDVYATEPLPADHPLRNLDNAILTGHTGYVIEELYTQVYPEAVEDIQGWMAGTPTRLINAD